MTAAKRAAAAATLLTLLTAGCTHQVPGVPRQASGAAPTVDLGRLDPGGFPTHPMSALGDAGDDETGRRIEGQRLAGHVAGPWQSDPSLIGGGDRSTVIVTDRKKLGEVLWPAIGAPAYRQPFLLAFSAERTATGSPETALRNSVFRFAGADNAAEVAAGMSSAALNPPVVLNSSTPIPLDPVQAVPIPGHPEATGALLTRLVGQKQVSELIVISARGPYVLTQVARSAEGPEQAAQFAGRALDAQLPLIDGFIATDPAQFAALPRDPTGLLARTLALPDNAGLLSNGSYDAVGALQLEENPVRVGPALTAAGVDTVTTGRTTVYRTADAEKAQQLTEALGDTAASTGTAHSAAAVPGLPQSRCVADTSGLLTSNWCFAAVDRYAIKAVAQQLDTAQQQIAAQYLMLTR